MKDSYTYDDSDILINLVNIRNQEILNEYETTLVRLAIIDMLKKDFQLNNVFDIYKIHKKLFSEVYEWAGTSRTIDIYKDELVLNGLSVNYSYYKNIDKDLEQIQLQLESLKINHISKEEFIKALVPIVAKIWQVHPFREGNTRVITVYLYFLMKKIGFNLNTDFINKHSKYFRNALVLASIGEYSEYNYLEDILLDSISFNENNDTINKYEIIKEYKLENYKYKQHYTK